MNFMIMNKEYQVGYTKIKTSVYQDTSEKVKRQTHKNAKKKTCHTYMYSIYIKRTPSNQ